MFTIKEFCPNGGPIHVSACVSYSLQVDKSSDGSAFYELRARDAKWGEVVHRVGPKHRERIVVENAAGKTVTNLHYNAESGHCTGI